MEPHFWRGRGVFLCNCHGSGCRSYGRLTLGVGLTAFEATVDGDKAGLGLAPLRLTMADFILAYAPVSHSTRTSHRIRGIKVGQCLLSQIDCDLTASAPGRMRQCPEQLILPDHSKPNAVPQRVIGRLPSAT